MDNDDYMIIDGRRVTPNEATFYMLTGRWPARDRVDTETIHTSSGEPIVVESIPHHLGESASEGQA